PDPVGELEPAGDAAVSLMLAVVVDQPAAPFPPQRRVLAARDQARVLHRDHRLVIVAIERPGLHLAFAALDAMQQRVARVHGPIPSSCASSSSGGTSFTARSPPRPRRLPSPCARHAGARANRPPGSDWCC